MITFFLNIQLIRAIEDDVNSKALRNCPMYDNTLKVTKNVSTKIALEVRRFDRKSIKVSQDKRYYLNVISEDGERFLIRKQFQPEDVDRGRMSALISPTELDDIEPGRYDYSVSYVNDKSEEYILYTNENTDGTDSFIVEHSAMPLQRPSFVQFIFTKVRTRTGTEYPDASLIKDTYISSRLPITKPEHVLEIDMENFTGKVKIQTTRSPDPNDQQSWKDHEVIDCQNEGNIQLDLEDLQVKYIRLQIEHFKTNEGKFKEIRFS